MKNNQTTELSHLKSTLADYQGNDKETLSSNYPNETVIVARLRNAITDIEKYEFLGEIFFQLAAQHAKDEGTDDARLELLQQTRFEVMQFYELARAAKLLTR